MYNKDIITVITRQPDFSQLETGTDEKIRAEFERIFGQQENEIIQGTGPIQFEDTLLETNHNDCDYPNLTLNIGQRQRARDTERRRKRLTNKEEEYPIEEEGEAVEENVEIVTDKEGEVINDE